MAPLAGGGAAPAAAPPAAPAPAAPAASAGAKPRGFRVGARVALGAMSVRIAIELDAFPAPPSNPNVRRPTFLRQKRRR